MSYDQYDELLSDDFMYDDGYDDLVLEPFDDIDLIDSDSEEDEESIDSVTSTTTIKNKNHYISPEALLEEFEKSLAIDEPTPKMIQYLFMIARGSSVFLKLKNSLDINSCITYAVSKVWHNGDWKVFDEKRSENIFSLYTTILLNAMRDHKNKIYKNSYKNIQIELFE